MPPGPLKPERCWWFSGEETPFCFRLIPRSSQGVGVGRAALFSVLRAREQMPPPFPGFLWLE